MSITVLHIVTNRVPLLPGYCTISRGGLQNREPKISSELGKDAIINIKILTRPFLQLFETFEEGKSWFSNSG